jgi:hypothetical protein
VSGRAPAAAIAALPAWRGCNGRLKRQTSPWRPDFLQVGCKHAPDADRPPNALIEMVLPVGIEPTTSPLPRECSTTELRQLSLGFA